jgi:hypothetical protein
VVKKQHDNLAMQQAVDDGECVDLSDADRVDKDYVVKNYVDGLDYCVLDRGRWIWSIGRHRETGVVLASTATKFYLDPAYECLWLR